MIITTERGPIEYEDRGKGPAVLYFHGGHSNCHETFGVSPLIASGFRLIVPSRPGYGKTSIKIGENPEEFADSVVELLDELEVKRVHVIGVSAGSPSALVFASKYSDRVLGIVLESGVTKSWIKEGDKLRKVVKIIFSPLFQSLIWSVLRIFGNLFPRYIAKQFVPSFSTLKVNDVMNSLSSEDVEEIRLMNNRYSSGHGFMLDIDHKIDVEVLRRIKNRTLVVHSRADGSVKFEHAEFAVSNIPGAELFESKAWGHLIWLGEEGSKVNDKVVEFLLKANN